MATLALAFVGSATAQDLAVCGGVKMSGPARVVDAEYGAQFSWSGEPKGAVRSEFASVPVNANADGGFSVGDGTRRAVKTGSQSAFGRGQTGTNSWSVILYNAGGEPICMTRAQTFVVAETSNTGIESIAEKTTDVPAATVAAVQAALGRYIIRLGTDNTFYTGTADRTIDGDHYDDGDDADDWRARGYSGLEIYGNQRNNTITGSDLSDRIHGGNESCSGAGCNQGDHLGDTIDGGAGDDEIHGGNETCSIRECNKSGHLGDIIVGGTGADTIHGGNESCTGTACNNSGHVGDTIAGNDGNDTINGGNEGCNGTSCGTSGRLGDKIEGGNDNDTISGGNETCAGTSNCGSGAEIGDMLNGGNGNDTIVGGTETSAGTGSVGDDLTASAGTDTVTEVP